jgi:hypothetical protein
LERPYFFRLRDSAHRCSPCCAKGGKEESKKKNEEEKKKVHLKKGANYNMREYEATWQSKEWMAFRYLGLAAGRYLF